jgi:thiol-disulfide isomerase/thioredoxin
MAIHSSLRVVPLLIAALSVSSLLSHAQSTLPLPGCEAAPEVRTIMDQKLDSDLLDKMKFTERLALQRQVLEDLMNRYPRELKPVLSYANVISTDAPEEYAALRERWVKAAKDHPDDPLALVVAGKALIWYDTPEAIRLLQAAKSKAPDFPWPDLYLAWIYSSGKRDDVIKTKENFEAFFEHCSASMDQTAQWLWNKDQLLQPKVAAALRASLQTETDPKRLRTYGTLWGLEFRTRPPNEHDVLRSQVALDLKRLEALNPHGDAAWEAFLIGGYKQSGAPEQTVTGKEDKLLHDFPHSNQAYSIVYGRWDKAHPKPEDQTDTAEWTKYNKEYKVALRDWIRDYPDNSFLREYAWFMAIQDDDALTERDGIAAIGAFLQACQDFDGPHSFGNSYPDAAEFLIEKKWQPERALDLLQQAKAVIEKDRATEPANDSLSDEDMKSHKVGQIRQDQYFDGLILRAAIEAGQPEPALKLKAAIEGAVPSEKKLQSGYWLNRARLEVVQKHMQDALAYYQLALATRTAAPKAYQGKVDDPLTDEARALWKQQGGTEAAWAVWSKPPGSAEQAAEGRWEKATKQIPDFELSDMTGMTWKLKQLAGKTLLINLWATWCGPCQSELPHLEKFYEKNKDRSDIQILTFDLDEDLGVVAPYLREKGYTFPVLPAFSTVVSLLDGFAIPQTWLVDTHGVWVSKQTGFGGGNDADFEKEMLQHIDAAKSGQ